MLHSDNAITANLLIQVHVGFVIIYLKSLASVKTGTIVALLHNIISHNIIPHLNLSFTNRANYRTDFNNLHII